MMKNAASERQQTDYRGHKEAHRPLRLNCCRIWGVGLGGDEVEEEGEEEEG